MRLKTQRYAKDRGTTAKSLTTWPLQVFQSVHLSVCLLGADSCQYGREAECFSGRRRQLVFPSNSGGLRDAALPPHQEPQPHTSTVGLHDDCYSYAVIFSVLVYHRVIHTFCVCPLRQVPVEHSRARPEVYLCWTRCWWTASQWELSEQQICSCIYSSCMSGFNRSELFYTFHNLLMMLQVQIWSFSPLAEETYTLKPTLTFWPIQTPGCNMSQLSLKVVGEGCKGFIEVGLKLYVSCHR